MICFVQYSKHTFIMVYSESPTSGNLVAVLGLRSTDTMHWLCTQVGNPIQRGLG
jgi:hypothetical protein